MKRIQKRQLIIFSIAVVICLVAAFLVVDRININNFNAKKHVVNVLACSADKEPLEKCFPSFGKIVDCRWDSGILHKNTFMESLVDIGPSQYWVNGYAVIGQEDTDKLLTDYHWDLYDKYSNSLNQNFGDIECQINFVNKPIWMKSDDLNVSFGGFFGDFYLDVSNNTIIFDLIRD